MSTAIPPSELVSVDPAGVTAYLRASGWTESGSYGRTMVWSRAMGDGRVEVLLPASAELGDYAVRIAELMSTLSTVEQRPAADVLRDLRSPRIDVQYIRMIPDGPSGTIPLHEGYLAVKGVRDLFLAAATSTVSVERPAVQPSSKPPEARGFLDQVRLGETSRGSYVLRIETPLPPPDIVEPLSSREVLLHLYQATSAAQTAASASGSRDFTPFGERVGEGVSANLCEALADIGGLRRSAFEMRFAWAPVAPVTDVVTPTVRFDRESIAALRGAARYLRSLPATGEMAVVGRVVELHRTPTDRLGRVQIDGRIELPGEPSRDERVIARLTPAHYDLAVSAHRASRPLRVTGRLRHTGRQYEVGRVDSVEIVE